MKTQIPQFLLSMEEHPLQPTQKGTTYSLPFIDRTLKKAAGFIGTFYVQGEASTANGMLQRMDARIKVVFLLGYILLISLVSSITAQLGISVFLFMLYLVSHIHIGNVYKKIFMFSFFFGFLVAAPASLNVITQGKMILVLWRLQDAKQFLVYHIPMEIGITREGVMVVARLYVKVMNSLALTFLVYYTTPFVEIIKALRIFRVPDMFLLIITVTYKFIFVLACTIQETYFALKMRWWRNVKNTEANKIIAGRVVYLFRMSWYKYEEVFRAMMARGFTGKVNFCYLGKISKADIGFLALCSAVSIVFYLI
jgi:cobalt/nickel transport system permease protein